MRILPIGTKKPCSGRGHDGTSKATPHFGRCRQRGFWPERWKKRRGAAVLKQIDPALRVRGLEDPLGPWPHEFLENTSRPAALRAARRDRARRLAAIVSATSRAYSRSDGGEDEGGTHGSVESHSTGNRRPSHCYAGSPS